MDSPRCRTGPFDHSVTFVLEQSFKIINCRQQTHTFGFDDYSDFTGASLSRSIFYDFRTTITRSIAHGNRFFMPIHFVLLFFVPCSEALTSQSQNINLVLNFENNQLTTGFHRFSY